MSKVLIGILAAVAVAIGGVAFFLTHSFGPAPGAAFLPALVWAGTVGALGLLVGAQLVVYNMQNHPDKFAKHYARLIADPRLEAEGLAKKLDRELAELKSKVLAELAKRST